MKKRFCLLIALLLSLCLSCAAEPILESTPFLLEAEELLELVDQYQQVPSVALGEEAALNLLKDAELILGAEPTDAQTILDTGAVITLADRAALNVHGALHGWIADIVLGEESEINVFLSDGALMDALLPEELVEPEKLEALKASFTYYGLNISDLDDPDSIYVFDASGNRIHFGNGDKTDSIVYPGEHYTVLVRSGVHTGRQLSFELDPSVPLSLAELLAQNPITAKLSLEATDVAEGADVPFTATLSRAARRKAVVALRVGEADYTIDIPAGASSGSVLVANPNGEDPYLDAGTLTATVTGFTGGDFEKVDYSGATVTANIADTIDTTTVSLSAPSVIARYADNVDFTITLSNPAQTSFTANFTVNGETSEIDVPAEKSSFTCSVPNPWKDVPNLDAFPAEISFTSSGNFEKLDFSGARTTVRICDPVVVSLSANDVSEYAPITFNVTLSAPATTAATVTVNVGGTDYTVDTTKVSLSASNYGPTDTHATFTVTLSNPAQTAADVTVNVGGTDYTVYIAASATSGSVSVLINGAPLLTGTVTGLTGANFEAVDYSTATATARTHYTATVSISGHDIGMSDGDIHFTIYLSKAPKTDATATVKVGDANQTVTISAGNTSASLYVRNPHLGELSFVTYTLSAEVTSISGGFTSVDCSGAKTTVSIMPVPGDWH